ncbi:unnamed protein product [Pleuronectes platessa]|uniref:Uncharacterized protein n=1 Tax=Pleuronectes platessa TaxID=8262 RepID=A0A9N7TZL1_PLEPL|nr:unnamed protein product [Pleuronectes platessa]
MKVLSGPAQVYSSILSFRSRFWKSSHSCCIDTPVEGPGEERKLSSDLHKHSESAYTPRVRRWEGEGEGEVGVSRSDEGEEENERGMEAVSVCLLACPRCTACERGTGCRAVQLGLTSPRTSRCHTGMCLL